jgi:hypothetical protein
MTTSVTTTCQGCQWTGRGADGAPVNFRTARSPRGHALDVLKSGLQKYIRRGDCTKALFCAGEIHIIASSALDTETKVRLARAKSVFTNLIHRLMIIFLEDCGPGAFVRVGKMTELLARAGNGRQPVTDEKFATERDAISHIVALLALGPHSRILSHLRAIWNTPPEVRQCQWRGLAELQRDILAIRNGSSDLEESAFDNAKGRILRAGHISEVIADLWIVFYPRPVVDPDPFRPWSDALKTCRESWLIPCARILYPICLGRNRDGNLDAGSPTRSEPETQPEIPASPGQVLDDFIYDKHTTAGRNRGVRSSLQFAQSGALVRNPDPFWSCSLLEEFYIFSKVAPEDRFALRPLRMADHGPRNVAWKESDLLEPIVRAQLVTGAGKTDTYIARVRSDDEIRALGASRGYDSQAVDARVRSGDRLRAAVGYNSGIVFVKGPLSRNIIQQATDIARLKAHVFAEVASVRPICMFCDVFDNYASPLGARTRCDANGSGLFIAPMVATRGLRPALDLPRETEYRVQWPLPTETRSSTMWPTTKVVDWSGIALSLEMLERICETVEIARIPLLRDIRLTYLFRFILAIGDGALRNLIFAVTGDRTRIRIMGTDEDLVCEPPCATWREFLGTLRVAKLKSILEDYATEREIIAGWLSRLHTVDRGTGFDISGAIARCKSLLA